MKPLDEADRDQTERNLAALDEIDKAIEGWTTKTDARQTGFSMHLKFTKKTDVMTSLKFANLMDNALPYAMALGKRLLKMDDEIKKLTVTREKMWRCSDGRLHSSPSCGFSKEHEPVTWVCTSVIEEGHAE